MNWDDLKFFLAVARGRSTRAAAQRLGVNHATVARRINALEHQLGVRLFERLADGYVCTEHGEEMRREAEGLEETIGRVERRVRGRDSELAGEIRVTLPDVLGYFLMPDLIRFSEKHPDIDLHLVPSDECLDLSQREADLAIRVTNDPPEELVGRLLVTYEAASYASRRVLEARGWEPLQHQTNRGLVESPEVEGLSGAASVKVPSRHRASNVLLQLAAAKAGVGIVSLPCFLGDPEPGLIRLPSAPVVPSYGIWILLHPHLRNTLRLNTFMRFMVEAFERHRPLMEDRRPPRAVA